jgi:hypothetical protein
MRKALLLALAVALLGGCAGTPNMTQDEMQADVAGFRLPQEPAPGTGMIYVVRPSPLGGLVRFNVFLNDQGDDAEMGHTRASQYIYFAVPAGRHRIYSKAENWAEIDVTVREGQVLFLQQETQLGIIMARNNLSELDEVQGKYYVKTLAPGVLLKTAAPGAAPGAAPKAAGSAGPTPAGPVKLDDLKDLLPAR